MSRQNSDRSLAGHAYRAIFSKDVHSGMRQAAAATAKATATATATAVATATANHSHSHGHSPSHIHSHTRSGRRKKRRFEKRRGPHIGIFPGQRSGLRLAGPVFFDRRPQQFASRKCALKTTLVNGASEGCRCWLRLRPEPQKNGAKSRHEAKNEPSREY